MSQIIFPTQATQVRRISSRVRSRLGISFWALVAGLSYGSIAVAAPPLAADVEVDRVEVSGVTVLSADEVQSSMEIFPGQRLDRRSAIRSAESLSQIYRTKGYERVRVDTRLTKARDAQGRPETILDFVVTEGLPTRIAGVKLELSSATSDVEVEYWENIRSRLFTRSGLLVGDILSELELNQARRVIEDTLATDEFIGAKVVEVKAEQASPPSNPPAPLRPESAHWVDLRLSVQLGGRVSFGFLGNKVLSRGDLLGVIEQQRLLGLGKEYIQDIRKKIVETYQDLGYADAAVEIRTRELSASAERHVTFVISEGPHTFLREVEFDGNSVYDSETLRDRFYATGVPLLGQGLYSEKSVSKASELLIEWIRSQGYLQAKLVTVNTIRKPRRLAGQDFSEMRVVLYIYEGSQTSVNSITFKGMSALTEAYARGLIGVTENKPLNLFAFSEGLQRLKTAIREEGYLEVEMVNEGTDRVVLYTQENRLADIVLEFNEGPRFVLTRVEVDGLQLTREYIVQRELRQSPGDYVSEAKVAETESALRKLGIFGSVSSRLVDDPVRRDGKILRILVSEASPGIVAGGFGFRNDLGPRLFTQAGYTNLGGRNQAISLFAGGNRRLVNYRFTEYQTQLSYVWPWFGLSRMTFRPTLSVTGTQYILFDAVAFTAAATWERQVFDVPNLTGLFTYSIERVNQFNARDAIDNQGLRIGTITPTLRYDGRDNPLSPSKGIFASASLDYASTWLGSQRDPFPLGYMRVQVRNDFYVSLLPRVIWYGSVRYGFERSLERPQTDASGNEIRSSGAIPLVKQFALGGVGTVRGFNEQEINLGSQLIRGTAAYVNYRTQLDLPLMGNLKMGPFLDAANLLADRVSLTSELRAGTGVGLRYLTPVGPVNLDWAFKVNPRPGEDPSIIHFSIGTF